MNMVWVLMIVIYQPGGIVKNVEVGVYASRAGCEAAQQKVERANAWCMEAELRK